VDYPFLCSPRFRAYTPFLETPPSPSRQTTAPSIFWINANWLMFERWIGLRPLGGPQARSRNPVGCACQRLELRSQDFQPAGSPFLHPIGILVDQCTWATSSFMEKTSLKSASYGKTWIIQVNIWALKVPRAAVHASSVLMEPNMPNLGWALL
jgi:hypothetical protein